jgi:hypothetical protein
VDVQLAVAALEIAAPHTRLLGTLGLSGQPGHARHSATIGAPLAHAGRARKLGAMQRILVLGGLCALLAGCGLAGTGAAAAGGSAAEAQQAAQARQQEERVRQQVEAINQQAADREHAAADDAGK